MNHGIRRWRNKKLSKITKRGGKKHYILRALLILRFSTIKPYTEKTTTPLTIKRLKTLECKKGKKSSIDEWIYGGFATK